MTNIDFAISEINNIAKDREEWQRKYFALLNQTVELQAQRDALLAACQDNVKSLEYAIMALQAPDRCTMRENLMATKAAIALTQKEEA